MHTGVLALLAACFIQGAGAGGVGESTWNQNQFNGNPNKSCPTQGTSNPINIVAQNKYHEEPLFRGAGQFPLEFKLYYNSRHYGPLSYIDDNGVFQTQRTRIYGNWSYSYSQHLKFPVAGEIHVVRENGQAIIFSQDASGNYVGGKKGSGGALIQNKDPSGKLIKISSGYQFFSLEGTIESFNLSGVLTSISNAAGRGVHSVTIHDSGSTCGTLTGCTPNTKRQIWVKYNQRNEELYIEAIRRGDQFIPSQVTVTGLNARFSIESDDAAQVPPRLCTGSGCDIKNSEKVGRIKSVLMPEGGRIIFDYGYSNATNVYTSNNSWLEQSALTGIRTFDSATAKEFESRYRYDENGYAVESRHGTGTTPAMLETVAPGRDAIGNLDPGHKRIVTNKLGKQTEYVINNTIGRFDVVNGVAMGDCGISNSTIKYDSYGNIDTITQKGDTALFPNDGELTVDYDYYQTTDPSYAGLPNRITIKGAENGRDRVTDYTWSGNDSGTSARLLRSIKRYEPGSSSNVRHQVNYNYQLGHISSITEQDNAVDPTGYVRAHMRTKTTSYRVDAWHDINLAQIRILTEIGPKGVQGTYEFAANGNLITYKNALNHAFAFSGHNVYGYPTTMVDPNNVTTTIAYDARGRLTSISAGGATTSFQYTVRNDLKKITFGDNSHISLTYDDGGTLVSMTDQAGERMDFNRLLSNIAGRNHESVTQRTFTSGNVQRMNSTVHFDALGRIWKIFDLTGAAGGAIATYKHDSRGNPISTTDGLFGQVTRVFDALGRLKQQTDLRDTNAAFPVRIDYDVLDNITSVTDQNNNQTIYHYDGFGNLLQVVSADTGKTSYYYDDVGNVVAIIDANNITTTYSYDALNRMTAIDYPTQADVSYRYDETLIDGQANAGVGRLTGILTSDGGRINWIYDARGNIVKDIRIIAGKTYTTTYRYDLAGGVTSIEYPTGRIVSYVRENGKLKSVLLKENTESIGRVVASAVTYEPFGPLKSFTYGNGLATNINYDGLYRVDTLATGNSINLDYVYDTRSNLDNINDLRIATATPRRSQDFDYDGPERLRTATGDYGQFGYAYDGVGNLTKKTWSKATQGYTETLSISPASNRLAGKARTGLDPGSELYSYSATGDTTAITKLYPLSFAYNDSGRMVLARYNGTQTSTYQYNGMGERDSKTANGQIRHFVYDLAGKLLHETSSDNSWRRDYIYIGDRLVAIADNSSPYGTLPNTWYGLYASGVTAPNIDISSGTLTVNSASLDYGQSYLAARQLVGNGALSAKVPALTGTGRGAEAGLEIRENSAVSANFVKIARYAKRKVVFIGSAPTIPILLPTKETIRVTVKDAAGERNSDVAVGTYQHLRVANNGNIVSAFASADGVNWSQIGASATLNLTAEAVIGFRTAGTAPSAVVQYASVAATGTAQINNGLYFVHTDHLGTPQEITDNTRTTLWEAMLNPYGEAQIKTAMLENNVRMPGQYFDAESGLHYNYFRDYDPKTGRYIQSDPIGLAGGLNTYSYAYGKPETFTDPTGEIVPAAAAGYLRCLAQCSASSAAADAVAGNCANLSGNVQNCAMDCVNPLNWFNLKKVGVVGKKVTKKGTFPDEIFSTKAPKQTTPGTKTLEGQYINDKGRVESWKAHYDEYGRQIGRTDYNAGNKTQGIPSTHHHTKEYNAKFPTGRSTGDHIEGEYKP